jgi:hypothetical protein
MLVVKKSQFKETRFKDEAELEKFIIDNYQHLSGLNSFYVPKIRIRTADGESTTPDGFIINIEKKRWYMVEAELARHGLMHIKKQVTTQFKASTHIASRDLIIKESVALYKRDASTRKMFKKLNIPEIDVHRHLETILKTDPIVAIPIDRTTNDLKQWASTVTNPVEFWQIAKFVQFPGGSEVIYQIDDGRSRPRRTTDQ